MSIPSWGSFGFAERPPSAEAARERIAFQDALMEPLVTRLVMAGGLVVGEQEEILSEVYSPLTATARRAVGGQRVALAPILRTIRQDIGGRMSRQRVQADAARRFADAAPPPHVRPAVDDDVGVLPDPDVERVEGDGDERDAPPHVPPPIEPPPIDGGPRVPPPIWPPAPQAPPPAQPPPWMPAPPPPAPAPGRPDPQFPPGGARIPGVPIPQPLPPAPDGGRARPPGRPAPGGPGAGAGQGAAGEGGEIDLGGGFRIIPGQGPPPGPPIRPEDRPRDPPRDELVPPDPAWPPPIQPAPAPAPAPPGGVMRGQGVCFFDPFDPDVCRQVKEALIDFAAYGSAFAAMLLDVTEGVAKLAAAVERRAPAIPYLGEILLTLTPGVATIQVVRAIGEVVPVAKRMGREEYTTLLGLYATRSILRMLEGGTFGWELGPQLLFNLHYTLPQVSRFVDELCEYACPTILPSVAELRDLHLEGVITDEVFLCLSRMHGRGARLATEVQWSARQRQDTHQVMLEWLRHRTDLPTIHARLRALGWLDVGERERLIASYQFQPTPTDAISFAVKDVFSPAKLGREEMEKEYRQQEGLGELFESQGMNLLEITTPDGRRLKYEPGLLYWLSHYHNVSPTQAFEMLHRLRPDRVQNYPLPGPGGREVFPEPVVQETVRSLLKEDDYNPTWRDRLTAISYRVLGRIDVRRIYGSGSFGEPKGADGFREGRDGKWVAIGEAERELVEQGMDRGLTRRDATLEARWVATDWQRKRDAGRAKAAKQAVCEAYGDGSITEEEAADRLREGGIEGDEAVRTLRECDWRWRRRAYKQAVAAIRKMVLSGEIDAADARGKLASVGVRESRIKDYLALWRLEAAANYREGTASQMCEWLAMGLISQPEMRVRLARIGYDAPTVERIVRHCVLGNLAKAAKERDKVENARRKERERQAKLAEKRRKEEERRRKEAAKGGGGEPTAPGGGE